MIMQGNWIRRGRGAEGRRGGRERLLVCLVLLCSTLFLRGAFAFNQTHLDRSKLPKGCVSCHKGHGQRGTLMLGSPKEQLCFDCHGSAKRGERGEARTDVYSVFLKRSNHPVLQSSQYHLQGETLPETSASAPRHVACVDCHDPHLTTKDAPLKVKRGYAGRKLKLKVKDVRKEYQVCYLCHSDSANLPASEHNVAHDFDPNNPSYHPVEAEARSRRSPSLKGPLHSGSTITCSDCHGNDDPSGPQGPHGSNFEHILKANYSTESGAESPSAYDLCYRCHNRNSILNDESFKSHKRHVVYSAVSCFACHASHGSRSYESLISFDGRIVSTNSQGQQYYTALLPGRPRCFLSCHVGTIPYDHVMKGSQYYVNNSPAPGW